MLTDVLRRPMFMQEGGMTMPMPMPMPMPMQAQPADNVGIMDGFAQGQPMENPVDQAKDYAGLMNLIRGNDASVEDRREELSQIVGRTDAMKTPESVLTLVQPTLAQFEQSAQAQQGIGSMPEAQQMMQGAGDMGQMMPSGDQQLAQDQQQVDMAQMTGQPVEAQEGLFTGVGGRTFYVNPTGGITTALPNTLPAVIPQGNVPAIRPIPGVPALGVNFPGAGITGTSAVSSIPPFLQPTSGAIVDSGIPKMSFKDLVGISDASKSVREFGRSARPYLAANPFGTAIGLGYGAAEIGKLPGRLTDSGYEVEGGAEEKFIKDFGGEILGKETSTGEAISGYYIEKNKKRLEDLKKRNAPGDKEAAAKLEKIIALNEPKKEEPKKEGEKIVPPPEKKFKARNVDEILNSEAFKKTQTAYEKLYGYDPEFLKGQAYQQLAQFGLNLASAKGGNTVQKIAESAKSPLATFAAIGAEAQKAKREGKLEAGKGAIKEAEFERKLEQYAEYGITPKEAILGAKTGDLKDLENARTAIQTGYGTLINKLPKEQRALVTENAAAIYKQEPTTAGLRKAENYIVSIIKGV
jgi:hypothetical protein